MAPHLPLPPLRQMQSPPRPIPPRPRAAAEGAAVVSALSQWLQLMLAEIARKQEEVQQARIEEAQREQEAVAAPRGVDPARRRR
jgi:hypothetical protein